MSLETTTVHTLPVLPLKNTVLFPHLFMPLSVGRPASTAATEAGRPTDRGMNRCGNSTVFFSGSTGGV